MSELLSVYDYERRAEELLDPGAYGYFAGGADDERALRGNVAAYARWNLRPRVLVDVGETTAAATVLGTPLSMPLVVAPTAFQRMAHPDGERDMLGWIDPTLSWRDLEEIAGWSPLPLLVKGILTAEDAALACEHGAAGVVVSNHGGRQLDGVAATIDALPEVVEAVGGRIEVLLDGGICRGADVVKALALGARAVLAGRAPLWGLAVDGEAGARRVLELLRDEITLALALCGCASPADVTRAHVGRALA